MTRFIRNSFLATLALIILVTGFDIARSYRQHVRSSSSNIRPPSLEKAELADFLISASHPKAKEPSPFIAYGRQMSFDHILIKDAYEKFPNVTACVANAQTSDTTLNLLHLMWENFNNDNEVRLCIFYTADILSSSERVEDWFRAQGMAIYAFTISETQKPPLPAKTIRGSFSEYVRKSCSIYSMFVAPIFNNAPWRPAWDVRRNAIGVQIAYMRDGKIAGVRVLRGSCLN